MMQAAAGGAATAAAAAARRRVVVTGLGIVSPLGLGAHATWEALTAGRVGVRGLSEADGIPPSLLPQLPCRVAAALPSRPEAPPGLEGAWSRGQLSPFIQYALVAAEEALASAGWRAPAGGKGEGGGEGGDERAGCYIGTGIGCLDEIVGAERTLEQDGVRRLSPHFVPKILGNLATGQVSIRHGLQGPNHACVTACASGAHAVGDAFRLVQRGEADLMVCGGSEACIGPLALAGFSRLRALSTGFNEDPNRASRPFDAGRDGFVMGEGAAVLVLEEWAHAKARGVVEPLAEVVGYGMAGDAHHITAPDPEGSGAYRAMRAALRDFSCGAGAVEEAAARVDYVNAHATSTPLGDAIEGRVLQRLLVEEAGRPARPAQRRRPLYVSSTKGATGHLLGAAGAIEAAFTVLALRHGVLPATANLEAPGPEAKEWAFELVRDAGNKALCLGGEGAPRLALSNSFGFGGVNVSLAFARWQEEGGRE